MNTPGTTERRDVLSALQLYRGAVNALATGQLLLLTWPLDIRPKPSGPKPAFYAGFGEACPAFVGRVS
ncbi:hypothetical protein [Serratia fonticola]